MGTALVQKLGSGGFAAATSVALTNGGGATTPGNHVLVGVVVRANPQETSVAITDSAGNTWQEDGTGYRDATNSVTLHTFSSHTANAIAASTGTITATATGGTVTQMTVYAIEISGASTSAWLDAVHTAGPTSSSTPSSGNATTSVAGDFAIGLVYYHAAAGIATAGSGWTLDYDGDVGTSTSQAADLEHQVLGAAGSYAATMSLSSSQSWTARIATYKAAPVSTGDLVLVVGD